jgi:hypothetical protein
MGQAYCVLAEPTEGRLEVPPRPRRVAGTFGMVVVGDQRKARETDSKEGIVSCTPVPLPSTGRYSESLTREL